MIDNSSDVKQRNNCKIVMREAHNYLYMLRNPLGFIDTYLTPDRNCPKVMRVIMNAEGNKIKY